MFIFICIHIYIVTLLKQILENSDDSADEDELSQAAVLNTAVEELLAERNSSYNERNTSNNKKRKLKQLSTKLQINNKDNSNNKLSSSIIIFTNSCQRCQELHEMLLELGVENVALHGMLPQPQRITSLGKFKSQFTRVLIATDVASRGLDIPNVDLVVNYDLPKILADYIHRIGRTARAGKKGECLCLYVCLFYLC